MMRKIVLCILFIMAFGKLYSQLQPMSEQYIVDGLSINPAYAGRREALSIAISYRHQWVGFEGAPVTQTGSIHSPLLHENVGVGLLFMNSEIGVTQESGIMSNYSFSFRTGRGRMSLGLGAGVILKNKNPNKLRSVDPDDEVLSSAEEAYYMPDFSAGVYYNTDNFFAGFSMPFFIHHRFNSAKGEYELYHDFEKCTYMATGGYLWEISDDFKLFPNTLYRYNPKGHQQADMSLYMILGEKFWLGGSYRTENQMIFTFQYQITNQLRIAYSYGTENTALSRYNKGTHEITLQYDFKYLVEAISPRYF